MSTETHRDEKGMISPDLLAILCCPETKEELSLLPADAITQLNQRISQGAIKNKVGQTITEPVDGGLLRRDQQIVYAIRDQIPIMLIEEGLVVKPGDLHSN